MKSNQNGKGLRTIRSAAVPMVVFAGLVLAATMGSGPAGADPGGSGSTDGGPIHDAVEEFGQSLCPKLVKPGSDLAKTVSEIQGNSGLAPTLTGMVTGLAIQLQCPAFMASLADGKLPEALQQAGNGPTAPLLQMPTLAPSPNLPKTLLGAKGAPNQ